MTTECKYDCIACRIAGKSSCSHCSYCKYQPPTEPPDPVFKTDTGFLVVGGADDAESIEYNGEKHSRVPTPDQTDFILVDYEIVGESLFVVVTDGENFSLQELIPSQPTSSQEDK